MKKNKLILTVGPPRSGKSTWSQQYIRENPNTVRINADRLREMLFAYNPSRIREYWNHTDRPKFETIVRISVQGLVNTLLSRGLDVIVDNMHLSPLRIKNTITGIHRTANFEVFIKEFNTPLKTCIARDQNSTRIVGKIYITEKYEQFQKLKETEYYKTLTKL